MQVLQIEQLELLNVKSHERTTLQLGPGINLILGENGSGKTTTVEAVGAALFQQRDYTEEQFRRKGERRGEIVVTLRAGDGRRFQVVRRLGGNPVLAVYDALSGIRLTSSTSDAVAWLEQQLGVEMGEYGRLLWSHAIGCSQGTMTAIFAEEYGPRKAVFGPLLRVDEYEDAIQKLAPTRRRLESCKQNADLEAARLETRLERKPAVEARLAELASQLAADTTALAATREHLGNTELQLGEHDGRLADLQAREHALELAGREVEALSTRAGEAARLVTEAEEAARVVAASRAGHQRYQAAEARRATLETQRAQRDEARAALIGTERELEAVRARLVEIASNLEEVAAAERRLDELGPLVSEQSRVEAWLDQAAIALRQRTDALDATRAAARRIEELRGSLETVRAKLAERARVEREIEALEARRADLESAQAGADATIVATEEQRRPLEAALREAERAEVEHRRRAKELARAEEALAAARDELHRVEEQVQERAAREATCDRLVEAQDAVRGRESVALAEVGQCRETSATLEARLAALETATEAQCPVCRSPLEAHRAGKLQAELRRERASLEDREQAASRRAQAAANERLALEEELKAERKRLAGLATLERAAELLASISSEEAGLERRREEAQALARVAGTVEERQQAVAATDRALEEVRGRRQAVTLELSQVGGELRELNAALRTLPPVERVAEIEAEIADAQAEQERQHAIAEMLAGAPAEHGEALAALARLGDPRSEATRQEAIACRGPGLREAWQAGERRRGELEARQLEESTALRAFDTLDAEIQAVVRELAATADEYRRHMANALTAATLDARREHLGLLHGQVDEASARRTELGAQVEAARAAYDSQAHQAARERRDELRGTVQRLEAEIRLNQSRWAESEAELEGLRQVEAALAAACATAERLARQRAAVDFAGETFRRAGRSIVKRLIETISLRADDLFRAITGDATTRLQWDESYAISARRNGETLAFKQLSGGEQMIAALAVRLALLLELSAVRMLFLDEPTAHLDELRRAQLAERIARLGTRLAQVVAITHDDTFASQAGPSNRITLHREEATNRTEVA